MTEPHPPSRDEQNPDRQRDTQNRSRRRFLVTVGGTATITGLSGLLVGTYAGGTILAPEPEVHTEGYADSPSSDGDLVGSAADVPWRDAVDLSDDFSVGGTYNVNDYSRPNRRVPFSEYFSIFNAAGYRVDAAVDFGTNTRQVEILSGQQYLVASHAEAVEFDVRSLGSTTAEGSVDISGDLLGNELWLDGTSSSPDAWFGTQ